MFIEIELAQELRGGQFKAKDATSMCVSGDDDWDVNFH